MPLPDDVRACDGGLSAGAGVVKTAPLLLPAGVGMMRICSRPDCMEPTAQILLALGGIQLPGLATDVIGQRTCLPRVMIMPLVGAITGPEMPDLLPAVIARRFELIASMGMALVATGLFPEHRLLLLSVIISTTVFFALIGPVFTRRALRRMGPA